MAQTPVFNFGEVVQIFIEGEYGEFLKKEMVITTIELNLKTGGFFYSGRLDCCHNRISSFTEEELIKLQNMPVEEYIKYEKQQKMERRKRWAQMEEDES